MKEHNDPQAGGRAGRRRFLGGLGAGGLAVAGAVFGRATPALANVVYQCCNLVKEPSHNLTQCQTGPHYTWSCSGGGGNHLVCQCCEHYDSVGVTVYSSASCQAVG
jgi:hypothetical protein